VLGHTQIRYVNAPFAPFYTKHASFYPRQARYRDRKSTQKRDDALCS
jgi:hypothetical protein